jgi:uncharacterized membrane protein YozB (DUF420 family)
MSDHAAPAGEYAQNLDRSESRSRFYLYLSLWMWVLAIVGFGPGYVSTMVDGSWIRSIPVHLHAAIYVGWLGLFAYQVTLPSQGQLARHRRFGRLLVGYACLMIVVGLVVTFSRFADRVMANELVEAQQNLIHPLSDLLIFPFLFGLAVYYRGSAETHKRLMVMATTFLLIAAVGRMEFLPQSVLVYDLVWLSPIWLAMLRDAAVNRMLHPAYGIGLLALGVVPFRTAIIEMAPYQDFTNWLAAVLG